VRDRSEFLDEARNDPAVLDSVRKTATSRSRHVKAPLHALACIEAAVFKPFDEGIQLEQRLFSELEHSDESKALRYAFFAEREVARVPGVAKAAKPEPVESAAVIGA